MDSNQKLSDISKGVPVENRKYRHIVGKLVYLSHTRPDVTFDASAVGQFMHSPYEEVKNTWRQST